MDNLMAKWKSTIDAQNGRKKVRSNSTEKPESDMNDMEYVKTQTQKIIDVISTDQDPPPCMIYSVSKFQQVCEIIQRVINKERSSKTVSHKAENKKQITDLEEKMSEIEREKVKTKKIYMKRENQEMKKQLAEMQERVNQGNLTLEVVNMLRESQQKLMEANTMLLNDIKMLKQVQSDKDKLWELEVEDIAKVMSAMKTSSKS